MLARDELLKIARARLRDAEVLFRARRYDGAIYLCGYAVEIKLKARICRTLHWNGYPSTKSDFQKYRGFRTHDLDLLLSLSGIENKVKANYLTEWSAVAAWDSNVRYRPIGSATKQAARLMIDSAKTVLMVLL